VAAVPIKWAWYGIQNSPAPGNIPGSRWEATGRLDASAMFGSWVGMDTIQRVPFGLLNDL